MQKIMALVWSRTGERTVNLAFADQALVSAANFVTNILLARIFGLHEFGRLTLALMVVEFTASLQFAAVLQPMLNIGPKQAEQNRDRYYGAVAVHQMVVCALAGTAVLLGTLLYAELANDPAVLPLAPALFACAITYQLHNFFRRYFFAREQPINGLLCDGLRFSIQLLLVLGATLLLAEPGAAFGIWAMAAACLVSSAMGMLRFGKFVWSGRWLIRVVRRHVDFSKWLVPSAVMFWVTSQAFIVLSGIILGPAVTGGLKMALSVTGLLNLLLQTLDNFAPSRAARAVHLGGRSALREYMIKLSLLAGALLLLGVTVLNLAPQWIIGLLYGEQYLDIAPLVRWFCIPALLYGAASLLIIWAAALEWTEMVFRAYIIATIFSLLGGWAFVHYGGVAGVIAGCVIVEFIRVAVLGMSLLTQLRPVPARRRVEQRLMGEARR